MNHKDRRWYSLAKNEAHDALKASVDETLSAERQRIQAQLEILRLYKQRLGPFSGMTIDRRTSRNTLRSVVKTVHSRLIAMKPIPFYCPSGGDAELRERLELLNTAVAGLFHSTGFEDKYASMWCLHGILLGTGFVKAYAQGSKVVVEKVYPYEVLIDPLDGLYGEPRSMYQLRWVDKPVLKELFPSKKQADAVTRASVERPEWAYWVRGIGEPVRVVEAWHLPDEDGEGGRHVISTSAGTLVDEEYAYDDFPIVPFQYSDPEVGFWADGVGQNLFGRQMEINRITEAVRETIRRLAWPRVLIPNGCEVSESQIDNTIGALINFTGAPPQVQVPPPLTREAVQYLSDLVASCYEDEGVSQYAAQAQKPAGIQSGRALRIVADQQDGRLREPGEKWTAARTRFGAALVRAQREAAKADPKQPILFTSVKKRETTSILWSNVDVDDSSLKLVTQPVSSLPQTPAAKAALLEELYNSGSGVITLEEYRDGIDLPDIAALTDGAKAPRRAIENILDTIVKTGNYSPPEPFFPLPLARQLGLQRYCLEYTQNTPEPILALLRRWCMESRDQMLKMLAEEAAAQQPPPPPQPVAPTGAEMAPQGAEMMPPPGGEMMPPEGTV